MNKILFVCSANKDRSATAEHYFAAKFPDLHFDSSGTNEKICFQLGTTFINEDQLVWANQIFVMEGKHRKFILSNFSGNHSQKINVLGIQDHYTYFQKELVELLDAKLSAIFRS